MRARTLVLVALLGLGPIGCKTLSEVSIGYADAVTTSELPEGSWTAVSVAFPGLTDMDPLASPSLSRYEVKPEEIESVKVTSVELEGDAGGCGLPFSAIEVQIVAPELGPQTLATGKRTGDCLTWELAAETELSAWFREPKISIVAVVDGQPAAESQGLALRVSFLVDVEDKPI
jgi:hypothetical protein